MLISSVFVTSSLLELKATAMLQQEYVKCIVWFVQFERHGKTKMEWSNYAIFVSFSFFRGRPQRYSTASRLLVWMLISLALTFFQLKKLKHFLLSERFFFFFLSLILLLLLMLLISIHTNCPCLRFQLFFSLTKKKEFSAWFNTFVSHDNGNRFLVLRFLL